MMMTITIMILNYDIMWQRAAFTMAPQYTFSLSLYEINTC